MPGSLYIDNPIDIAFADFTNSDFQCFHGLSPRPSFVYKRAPADHCSTSSPALQSSMPDKDPSGESSNPAALRSETCSVLIHHHKKPAEPGAKNSATRRVLARPAARLQQARRYFERA